MTVAEIYKTLSHQMITGLMIHEQLANYYDFLALAGYKRCHEYHYLAESIAYRKVCRYYTNHHNKIIEEVRIDVPEVVPSNWYKYDRQDVDMSTKKGAVKNGIVMWVDWERETKELYQNLYNELLALGEVASANFVASLICDVDHELKIAERHHLKLKSVDFDISMIIGVQDHLHKKYKKCTKKIGELM